MAICKKCGTEFEGGEIKLIGATFRQNYCDPCIAENDQKLNAPQAVSAQKWEDICPKLYAAYRFEKLPEAGQRIAETVFAWQPSEKGIGLIGESFCGKSFILHELFHRWHGKKSMHITTATEFAWACGSTDQKDRRAMIQRVISVEMLLLDDLGKEKMTERTESDLYHVLEQRRRSMKPIFITVNSTSEQLAKKMSPDSSEPILNRIKEMCQFHGVKNIQKEVAA